MLPPLQHGHLYRLCVSGGDSRARQSSRCTTRPSASPSSLFPSAAASPGRSSGPSFPLTPPVAADGYDLVFLPRGPGATRVLPARRPSRVASGGAAPAEIGSQSQLQFANSQSRCADGAQRGSSPVLCDRLLRVPWRSWQVCSGPLLGLLGVSRGPYTASSARSRPSWIDRILSGPSVCGLLAPHVQRAG